MWGSSKAKGIESREIVRATAFALAVVLGVALLAGGAAAHDDGDGLTVHNQTKPLDQHGEIHTLHIDKATADTDFYVDVHTDMGTINKTQTLDAGTVKESFDITLEPTLESDTEVTVATHAANGTELAAETIAVDVVDAPTVSFSDQTHELDEHGEIHTIDVAMATANQDYYVDFHTSSGTINTTQTFEAGTVQSDLTVTLEPTLESTTEVTAAVHATNGTELAAESATVTVAGGSSEQTEDTTATAMETATAMDSETATEASTSTPEATPTETPGDSGPGFGLLGAVIAFVCAALLVRYRG